MRTGGEKENLVAGTTQGAGKKGKGGQCITPEKGVKSNKRGGSVRERK